MVRPTIGRYRRLRGEGLPRRRVPPQMPEIGLKDRNTFKNNWHRQQNGKSRGFSHGLLTCCPATPPTKRSYGLGRTARSLTRKMRTAVACTGSSIHARGICPADKRQRLRVRALLRSFRFIPTDSCDLRTTSPCLFPLLIRDINPTG